MPRLSPLIRAVVGFNNKTPLSGRVESATAGMLSAMQSTDRLSRMVVFQILSDYFCPRCGIEQPEGDCQCQEVKE